MTSVAVIAHTGKSLEGGLPELRKALDRHGVSDPLWFEVPKSSQAPKQLRTALQQGADLIFVWGGDGMVQRCVDVVAGTDATIAIMPAGTANLFASNLGVPKHVDGAVEVGLTGDRRKLDVGRLNGEMFAVMAGVGFDARVIRDASPEMKRHFGRSAYVWAGAKNLHAKPFDAQIVVDGHEWYEGQASLVLFGNVGNAFAGVKAFADAHPDDGLLEIGVGSADGAFEWGRTLARSAFSSAEKSRFVHMTKGRSIKVKLNRKVLYELDGGDREKKKTFRVEVQPSALTVCVPAVAA
jgi:YegS/Rv2252/BmrU family lipid kinase